MNKYISSSVSDKDTSTESSAWTHVEKLHITICDSSAKFESNGKVQN